MLVVVVFRVLSAVSDASAHPPVQASPQQNQSAVIGESPARSVALNRWEEGAVIGGAAGAGTGYLVSDTEIGGVIVGMVIARRCRGSWERRSLKELATLSSAMFPGSAKPQSTKLLQAKRAGRKRAGIGSWRSLLIAGGATPILQKLFLISSSYSRHFYERARVFIPARKTSLFEPPAPRRPPP